MFLRRLSVVTSIALAMSVPPTLHAQSADSLDSALNEIVVTARKKPELLQDVPASIQVFSEAQLERYAIDAIEDVAQYSPSIVFDRSATPEGSSITVRGLAPTRGRSSVAVLVDGIDVTSETLAAPGGGILLSTQLMDVARIEVVRGPHSVDYGRSAFAGAIQYVTRDPGDVFAGSADVGIGSDGRYEARGTISGPIVAGTLSGGLTGAWWTTDGYYHDQATGSPLGEGDAFGTSGTLLFTPSDNVSLKGRLEYFEDDTSPAAQVLVRSNSGLVTAAINPAFRQAVQGGVVSTLPFALFRGQVPDADELGNPLHSPDPLTGDQFRGFERDVWRASLVGTWTLDKLTLNSWTGLTNADSHNRQDFDQDAILSGPPGAQIDISPRTSVQDSAVETDQFSQELRLSTDWDYPVQVTVGGLYWAEDSERVANTVIVTCPPEVEGCENGASHLYADLLHFPDVNLRETDHWSLYSSLAWEITSQWQLTAELRYSNEDELVTGTNCGLPTNSFGVVCGDPFATSNAAPPVFGPSSVLGDRRTVAANYGVPVAIRSRSDYLTPRFIVEWEPVEGQMYYASMAKGVKPGGTSTIAAGSWFDSDLDGDFDELQFDAEKMWSYELGAKLGWFDNRVLTNLAVFHQDYTDKQVVSTTSTPSNFPVAIIENAGKATIDGLELEAQWRVTDRLQLGLSYTYLDAGYDDFVVRSNSKSTILTAPSCTPVTVDSKQLCELDLSGNELEKAPEHALAATAHYSGSANWLVSGADWFTEADGFYQSKRYIDQSNVRTLDSYWLANLRAGLTGDRWETFLYVDNVFDDDTIRSADVKTGDVDRVLLNLFTSTSAVLATLPDPRTYGLRANLRF